VSFCAFVFFVCFVVLLLVVDLNIGFAGAHDGDQADAGHEVVQGQPSTEVADEDDEQIIQCLEHVWVRLVLFIIHFCCLYGTPMWLSQVVQALSLTRACLHKQTMEATQVACVA
jgi:hypothetical protein